ncbi:MAG: hypothetical protein KDK36_17435, partial [Leptospiraceae bacterium]|nr:hypothetical protein [Leptospiraceae bacterium]
MNNYTSIFTEKSSLTIDSKGKILNLTLNNGNRERTIIKANPFDPFFSSGNYLLFPWVNRLKTNKIKFKELETVINPIAKDSNNLALHGLIANSERDFTVLEESETESKIEFQPKEQLKNFPSLKEIFVLKHDSIEFQIQFSNISNSNQYFSFG